MTSLVFARGNKWSGSTFFDGWRETTTDEQAEALGALVVERFEALARAAGSTVFWQPATAEVIGEVVGTGPDMWQEVRDDGGETTTEQLETWREQATGEVWACVLGESDDADLCAKVAEALAMLTTETWRPDGSRPGRGYGPRPGRGEGRSPYSDG